MSFAIEISHVVMRALPLRGIPLIGRLFIQLMAPGSISVLMAHNDFSPEHVA
jgi:hypothetical protein